MTDESKGTPAAGVEPNAPAVAPPPSRPEVDLSDLQAEMDAEKARADDDEIFDDIAGKKPKDDAESDEDDSDEEDAEADEESDEGEDEDEEDDDADTDDEEKPRSRTERRREKRRERLSRLQRENAQLRNQLGSQIANGSLTKAQFNEYIDSITGPEPQLGDFDTESEYRDERVAWLTDRKKVVRDAVQSLQEAQRERSERLRESAEAHYERVEEFKNRNGEQSVKDWEAHLGKARDLKVAPMVEELILESPKSAHLQYFFARNPKRLNAINGMSERHAAKEIAYIEHRLSLPQPRTKSAAPPPKRAPKGGASPTSPEADLNSWLKKKYG